jgi:hypothetical protein
MEDNESSFFIPERTLLAIRLHLVQFLLASPGHGLLLSPYKEPGPQQQSVLQAQYPFAVLLKPLQC